ncbi:MAG: hypothetical protein ACFCUG_07570 [Thiotrichales bacterium]
MTTMTQTHSADAIIGTWEKATESPCSETYPQTLQFQTTGLLFGRSEPAGSYTHWDAGTYEIHSDTAIKISTANDEIVTYLYRIQANELIFADPAGCEFRYRRSD